MKMSEKKATHYPRDTFCKVHRILVPQSPKAEYNHKKTKPGATDSEQHGKSHYISFPHDKWLKHISLQCHQIINTRQTN